MLESLLASEQTYEVDGERASEKSAMTAESDGDGVVLIVDDDESIRETLQLALQLEDHPTALARNGREALEWLKREPLPSLILLDLMMPIMDGWQTLAHLQDDDRLKGVPVIVITAFGRDLDAAARVPVLRKPIDLVELLRIVATYRRTASAEN